MASRGRVEPPNGVQSELPDRTDQALLEILRYYCFSYARPKSQAWEEALLAAEVAFGPELGGVVASGMMRSFKAMRRARKSCFEFANPFCACCRGHLRVDERRMIVIISAVRNGNKRSVQSEALILCEGFDPQPMLHEIERLAQHLPGAKLARRRMVFR
ncbi:hypothetical protein [Labrenzia sp. CE80]|uniref:hypothetical protein n=1 Tax=Labrenzia sp. CE80 TaxID=1788986 RepID=UPI00129B2E66|nr:hypothetical protein [Labrenzia sp. CE80]